MRQHVHILATAAVLLPSAGALIGAPSPSAGEWRGWTELRPIGHIESCWPARFGAPRQGSIVPDSRARLRLDGLADGVDGRAALDGLADYSHVWLLWAAHRNGHAATRAKVRAPRLRGGKAGVFATRSPYRQNPIGLSLVRLCSVEADELTLGGVDLVSGTPVLDVKPYVPQYDSPQQRELDPAVRTASWIDPPALPVRFSPTALDQLATVAAAAAAAPPPPPGGKPPPLWLLDADALRRTLEQSLAADPRPLYRWRRESRDADARAEYDVVVDGVLARCRFERVVGTGGGSGAQQDEEEVVTVVRVAEA